ncbi:MAG: DNA replication/repair protein RecF [Bacteroidota bacterium]
MHLKKLSLVNFKNYSQAELDCCPDINCFTGNNGEGKTNLLDAIHYLCFTKSVFNPLDTQNIRHDEPFFVIQGTFELKGEEEEVYCGQKRGHKKQFKRNKKEYGRLADHIGLLPCVMVSPGDSELVYEGSEERRKFIDSIISQLDKEYLEDLIAYNRALMQRNALLRHFAESGSFDSQNLGLWDEQLSALGTRLYARRKEFIAHFIQLFRKHFRSLSGGREEVDIAYESQLHHGELLLQLQAAQRKDRALEYTTVGIHKDDLEFTIGDKPIKKFGSQGQQKSLLVALRLAQFDIVKSAKGFDPILLLDDISDKLDESRLRRLMEMVGSHHFGQIFITDTSRQRIQGLLKGIDAEIKFFNVAGGHVEAQ